MRLTDKQVQGIQERSKEGLWTSDDLKALLSDREELELERDHYKGGIKISSAIINAGLRERDLLNVKVADLERQLDDLNGLADQAQAYIDQHEDLWHSQELQIAQLTRERDEAMATGILKALEIWNLEGDDAEPFMREAAARLSAREK